MAEAETAPELTYDDAVRIRGEVKQLERQLGRIIAEARAAGRSATQIAYELHMVESRVYQILRAYRKNTDTR